MSSDADSPTDRCALIDNDPLSKLVFDACARIQYQFDMYAPSLAAQVLAWMRQLSPTGRPPEYFLQPQSFPLLPLIGWAADSFSQTPDEEFVGDVIYSTVNGYYYIRLLDNLIDGHATTESAILPATAFFHTEFQSVYQKYFAVDHPFWETFRTAWFSSSEAVSRELVLTSIKPQDFETVTVKKLEAARIPVTAIAYRYEVGERVRPWLTFTSALARWSQLEDDLFDWHRDLGHGKTSYLLTEAKQHPECGSAEAWVIGRGFHNGLDQLERELLALRGLAARLGSPEVIRYLDQREVTLRKQKLALLEGLKELEDLLKTVDSDP